MSRIEYHKEEKGDCVKIYLDTLLWQIKPRQQRALCRRGLNNFYSMKNEAEVECEGKFLNLRPEFGRQNV